MKSGPSLKSSALQHISLHRLKPRPHRAHRRASTRQIKLLSKIDSVHTVKSRRNQICLIFRSVDERFRHATRSVNGTKGRFPLPEFTARVHGPSWRPENSGVFFDTRQLGPWTRVVEMFDWDKGRLPCDLTFNQWTISIVNLLSAMQVATIDLSVLLSSGKMLDQGPNQWDHPENQIDSYLDHTQHMPTKFHENRSPTFWVP